MMDDLAVLFCRPDAPQGQGDSFDLESYALEALGLESAWVRTEHVIDDPEEALAHIDASPGRTWLFRGWMLSEEEYEALYEALAARGERLFVRPDEYALTLYLPNYYPFIERQTAASVWTEDDDAEAAWEVAQAVPGPPWFVKDHVKSAKEDWLGACVVGDGASKEEFVDVCRTLRATRGERFERGFVVREWLSLAELGGEGPNGAPLHDEHRLVFWQGTLVAHAPYHDADAEKPPVQRFARLGQIGSPFFTADIGRLRSGPWVVIELNDGGVSTLPPLMDPRDLYEHVKAGFR